MASFNNLPWMLSPYIQSLYDPYLHSGIRSREPFSYFYSVPFVPPGFERRFHSDLSIQAVPYFSPNGTPYGTPINSPR
jgi:hypothetical protein